MLKRIKYLSFLILFVQVVQAGTFGKYAGSFLSLGAGSRILAMGGAGTATVNDVTAGYWNPAALTRADGFQIAFMHSKQFISSIQHNYLGLSNRNSDGSVFGFSVMYLAVTGIKDSRDAYNFADDKVDYSQIRYFSAGDYAFVFSYAKPYNQRLTYGMNVKMIYRDYHSQSAYGLGFDAGLDYQAAANWRLGLTLRDITSTMMAWSGGTKEFIAPSLRIGTSYLLDWKALGLTFQPAADFNIIFENRQTASEMHLGGMSLDTFWGVEVAYKKLIAVRAGLDDLQRFNTGIGLQIPKINFAYSFTAYDSELGNIQRISVRLQLDRLF